MVCFLFVCCFCGENVEVRRWEDFFLKLGNIIARAGRGRGQKIMLALETASHSRQPWVDKVCEKKKFGEATPKLGWPPLSKHYWPTSVLGYTTSRGLSARPRGKVGGSGVNLCAHCTCPFRTAA